MMVHEVRCFRIRFIQQLVLVFKAIFLAGRVTVLLEQTGELELPPDRCKTLHALDAKRLHTIRVKSKIGDVDEVRDHAEKTLNSQRNTFAAQDHVRNLRKIAFTLAG